MLKRDHLIKPILDYPYPTAAGGQGIYLYDTEGKTYIDGSSGAVTASIGHGVKEIMDAMLEQASKVSFVYRSQFTSEPAELLAEKLSKLAPGDLNWSFFVNSGSEATETAMKIAIQYWQERGIQTKNKIISRWMSYHGITMGALSMSGHVGRRERFVPILDECPKVSAPYCYRCPFHQAYPACQLLCAKELDRAIKRIGKEKVAAFIAEPIIGAAAAAVVPPDGYYQEIKEICEQNGILFIADEVMTGIGRTGKMFGINHWGVTPDIIALGKGMSAGYTPIAATLVSDRVMEPILQGTKSIMSGHTYSANPQSAAVALAVLKYIEQHNVVENAEKNGLYLMEQLKQLAATKRIIGEVRGKGMLVGVEFVANPLTKETFYQHMNITNKVIEKAMENGLLLYPASAGEEGINGSAILIAPPLIITKAEINLLLEKLNQTIDAVESDLEQQGLLVKAV